MAKIPVYIVGINPRSGTNYLYHLLASHPDCVMTNHNGEDFILSGINLYLDFFIKVTYRWKVEWKNNKERFRLALESGINSYLDPVESNAKYMISKTPEPTNIPLFLQAFPNGYLVIITRNGQDLVESYSKSFVTRFDDCVRGWTRGARIISEAMSNPEIMNSGRVILIKYEDLYLKNQEVMTRLLEFLKLDTSKFDFEKSQNFDVIGSSSFKGKSNELTWKPIAKDETFNPLNRFSGWSRFKHYRFNWLAGKYSRALGYKLYYETKSPLYYLYNVMISLYNLIFRIKRRTKIIVKAVGKSNYELRRALDVQVK